MKKSYELYNELITAKGVTSYRVSQETGVPRCNLSTWKNKNWTPKPKHLLRICDYLSTPERPVTIEDFYRLDVDEAAEKDAQEGNH